MSTPGYVYAYAYGQVLAMSVYRRYEEEGESFVPAYIELLSAGELYAQEVVGRLGIAQSAVSRHLALLERAGVIRVRPHGGMKYYAVNCERMDALADALRRSSRQS